MWGMAASEVLRHKQKSDNYPFMRNNQIYTPNVFCAFEKNIIHHLFFCVNPVKEV